MPTYDYQCEKCGFVFDAYLPMAEMLTPTKEPCPECGKGPVKRAYTESPAISGDTVSLAGKKPDRDFRNLMKTIKKKTGGRGQIDRWTD